MPNYSVAQARNGLPRLIDKAIAGEEVVITRHGKVVAEVRAKAEPGSAPGISLSKHEYYQDLRNRAEARGRVSINSVDLINGMYEETDL